MNLYLLEAQIHKKPWLIPLIYIFIALLVFWPGLNAPLYFDDQGVIGQNLWVKQVPAGTWYAVPYIDSNYTWRAYRPTLLLTYWLNHWILPTNLPFILRLGSAIIHALNAGLVFTLSRKIVKSESSTSILGLSFFTGLLFLLHPVQTLGIEFIWKRSTLLCTFFILGGMVHWVRERSQHPAVQPRTVLIQCLLFFLAATSKEEGVLYPFFVVLADLLLFKSRNLRFFGSLALIAGAVLAAYLAGFQNSYTQFLEIFSVPASACEKLSWGYFQTSLSILPQYFSLMFRPAPRILDEPIVNCAWFTTSSLVFLGIFAFSVFLWIRSKQQPWLRICLGLMFLGFLPNSSWHPLLLVMDQIRMYVPLIGFCGILSYAIWAKLPPRLALTVCTLITLFYGTVSGLQSARYRSPELIWLDVLEAYPQSALALDQFGALAEEKGNYTAAAQAFQKASQANPQGLDFKLRALQNRARAGENLETLRQEYAQLNLVGATRDKYLHLHLVILEYELGLYEKARQTLLEFQKTQPYFPNGHYILGQIFEKQGDLQNAWKAYANTIRLDPTHQLAMQARDRVAALLK